MSRDRTGLSKALLAGAAVVIVVAAVLGTRLTVLADSGAPTEPPDDPPAGTPREPEPEPEPEPDPCPFDDALTVDDPKCVEPEPEPVTGDVEVAEVVDLSVTGTGLFRGGSSQDAPVAIDEEAVAAFAEQIGSWVDAHLTARQLGEPGTIPPFEAADDSLAGPDRFVTDAAYQLRVYARGGPEWAEATITVTRDDATATAQLVVTPGEEPGVVAATTPEVTGDARPSAGTEGGG